MEDTSASTPGTSPTMIPPISLWDYSLLTNRIQTGYSNLEENHTINGTSSPKVSLLLQATFDETSFTTTIDTLIRKHKKDVRTVGDKLIMVAKYSIAIEAGKAPKHVLNTLAKLARLTPEALDTQGVIQLHQKRNETLQDIETIDISPATLQTSAEEACYKVIDKFFTTKRIANPFLNWPGAVYLLAGTKELENFYTAILNADERIKALPTFHIREILPILGRRLAREEAKYQEYFDKYNAEPSIDIKMTDPMIDELTDDAINKKIEQKLDKLTNDINKRMNDFDKRINQTINRQPPQKKPGKTPNTTKGTAHKTAAKNKTKPRKPPPPSKKDKTLPKRSKGPNKHK